MTAVDYAKILAALNTDTLLDSGTRGLMLANAYGWDSSQSTGTTIQAVKGGLLVGLQSTLNFTLGGIAYVLYWNRSDLDSYGPSEWFPTFPSLTNAINATAWPEVDLFPTFAIASFPTRPTGPTPPTA